MDLKEAMRKMKYDKRLVRWNIQNKVMTEDDYTKRLSKLEDSFDLSEPLTDSSEKAQSSKDSSLTKDEFRKNESHVKALTQSLVEEKKKDFEDHLRSSSESSEAKSLGEIKREEANQEREESKNKETKNENTPQAEIKNS